MIAQSYQVKVTLPYQLYTFIQEKADIFGLNLAAYIRTLILNDIKQTQVPIYKASQKLEKKYQKALKERPSAKKAEEVEDFLRSL